ncbi:phage holin family protein [Phocaeicola sp.]
MFANDNNIDNLQQLFAELKQYAELQKDYVKLHLVEKLTILVSTLILVLVLVTLGIIALFYLSFTLAYVLEPHVGGLMVSYGIISGCIILLVLLIVIFRKRLIMQPMVNFLANLLLNDE